MTKHYPLGKYGLTIVLSLLFFSSWIAQWHTGWKVFESEQKQKGQVAQV